MTKEREEELKGLMELELEQTGDFFAYDQWDGLIENDEITEDELDYMDENYRVEVTLVKK